jgi:hypothetical protein
LVSQQCSGIGFRCELPRKPSSQVLQPTQDFVATTESIRPLILKLLGS